MLNCISVIKAAHQFYSGKTYVSSGEGERKRRTSSLITTVQPEDKRKIIGDTFMKVGQYRG